MGKWSGYQQNEAGAGPGAGPEDAASLLKKAKAGCQESQNTLLSRNKRFVIGLAIRAYGLSPLDAEDVFQTASRRFIDRLPTVTNAKGFLALAATTACLNLRRGERRRRSAMNAFASESRVSRASRSPEERLVTRLDLEEAMAVLSVEQRELIRSIVLERVKYRELSDKTGKPIGSIGPEVRRSLNRLKEHLRRRGYDNEGRLERGRAS